MSYVIKLYNEKVINGFVVIKKLPVNSLRFPFWYRICYTICHYHCLQVKSSPLCQQCETNPGPGWKHDRLLYIPGYVEHNKNNYKKCLHGSIMNSF